jgi:hypothetical protein
VAHDSVGAQQRSPHSIQIGGQTHVPPNWKSVQVYPFRHSPHDPPQLSLPPQEMPVPQNGVQHDPSKQTDRVPHGLPQAPQCALLVWVSTHTPLHRRRLPWHAGVGFFFVGFFFFFFLASAPSSPSVPSAAAVSPVKPRRENRPPSARVQRSNSRSSTALPSR